MPSKKLKRDKDLTGLMVSVSAFTLLAFIFILAGPAAGINAAGIVFLLYSLFSFYVAIKTQNLGYRVAGLYQLFVALTCFVILENQELGRIFLLCFFVTGMWLAALAVQKKLKWRGRELLELAARRVDSSENGFTARPMPAGKTEVTEEELLNFTTFISKNLIALPYRTDNKVFFVPLKMGQEYNYLLGFTNPQNGSWISFDFNGQVSVNISKTDYYDFQDDLTFDRLCQSLADLFIEFLEMYRKDQGVRIIDRLNKVRIGIFS